MDWIPIDEAVPKTSEFVQTKTADGEEHEDWYMNKYMVWYDENYHQTKKEVIAWKPLHDSENARAKQAFYFPKIAVDDSKDKSHHPHDIGIYILFKHGKIVYVGQSKHIHHRIYEHQTKHDIGDFDSYMYFETDDRMRLEAFLIQLLQPEYNIALANTDEGKWRWTR